MSSCYPSHALYKQDRFPGRLFPKSPQHPSAAPQTFDLMRWFSPFPTVTIDRRERAAPAWRVCLRGWERTWGNYRTHIWCSVSHSHDSRACCSSRRGGRLTLLGGELTITDVRDGSFPSALWGRKFCLFPGVAPTPRSVSETHWQRETHVAANTFALSEGSQPF